MRTLMGKRRLAMATVLAAGLGLAQGADFDDRQIPVPSTVSRAGSAAVPGTLTWLRAHQSSHGRSIDVPMGPVILHIGCRLLSCGLTKQTADNMQRHVDPGADPG